MREILYILSPNEKHSAKSALSLERTNDLLDCP
ncbi:unnamed protein product [Chondrus crispus]|uniref:Uncharacterized protein n=1 Tax=Chondrus crispus TaxID=2769 RepID=R7QHY5_CHOCR|nr:unnamed protein product [Chondrus crispus]CDF37694.1 unnamed protein product [Chondrus crispus]|eukprot:XP_005717565.1 unnamed protein product [Chondrus crispus]